MNYRQNNNYCRNPDNDKNGPWCYLQNYSKTFYKDNGFIGRGRRRYYGRTRAFVSNIGYCKKLIPQCKENEKGIVAAAGTSKSQEPSENSNSNPRGKCFSADNITSEMTVTLPYFTEPDNRIWCRNQCKNKNFIYSGVQTPKLTFITDAVRECKCFNSFDNPKKSNNCNRWCQDFDQNKFCGGDNAMNVWKVN